MGMSDFAKKIYGKYFEELPSKQAYLERIGLSGREIPLTREGLDLLQWSHLLNIPFENIDLFDYDIKVDFGIAELFDKVVTRRRGGYCFELNAIFMELIKAVGFEVYPVGVRIFMGAGEEFIPALSHRGSIAVIDGKRWFSDVGFGLTNAPGGSICIDTTDKQDIRGSVFWVEDRPYNNKMIMRETQDGPRTLFMFVPDPFQIVDFVAVNSSMAATGWRAKRIANLRTPDGAKSVDGDIFRVTKGAEITETKIETAGDAMKILKTEFGMELTSPLRDEAFNPAFPF